LVIADRRFAIRRDPELERSEPTRDELATLTFSAVLRDARFQMPDQPVELDLTGFDLALKGAAESPL
jgi:hypothetical protein